MKSKNPKAARLRRRRWHVRKRVVGTPERPRLSVYRSIDHIYAQVIDDSTGRTLASASTLSLKIAGGNVNAAKEVGKAVAEKAKACSVEAVCFDRGGRLYHGRVKALAEAARKAGLKF